MFSLWINNYLVNTILTITAFLALLLVIFPELDVSFSELFFSIEKNSFIYKKKFLVYQIYKLLPWLTKLFVLVCVIYLVYITIKYRSLKKIIRSGVFFLFITAIVSPGLIVNEGFKENFGRARPNQIEEFNGTKDFTRAFKISNQCEHNCSFSSGHAAMGYFFSAIAYTTSLLYFNRIYIAGVVFGSIVGLSRIMMGGHFLSDVVVSAFIVLFFNHIIFILWQMLLRNLKK
jgi:lipid A 4'-phosphatase